MVVTRKDMSFFFWFLPVCSYIPGGNIYFLLEKIKDLFINYYNSGTLQICILVHLVLYVDIILYTCMHIYLFVATFINIHNVCMY